MKEISASKVFVSIDPACGGDKSRMAIISAIYVDNEMIVSIIQHRLLKLREGAGWGAEDREGRDDR
jgi:hypothetical protein